MKEAKGNLWEYPADLVVITTNGFVKKNGKAVMGRGCAKEATQKIPAIELALGNAINKYGNHTHLLKDHDWTICCLPVKHNWYEKADIALIKRSVRELVDIVDEYGIKSVVLPRPGCGNGGLSWKEVKRNIEGYLDDRFTVITY